MQSENIGPLSLYYPPEEAETARIVSQACQRSLQVIHETWELEPPADLRIYIMTSWRQFLFESAPWHWRLMIAVTLPLWVVRIQRLWQVAGGWSQRYGRRQAVGVKPPRLIAAADKRFGGVIFEPVDDPAEKIQQITCHELAHACTAHLRLPPWINEGLAMVTVDRFSGKQTVRQDTLSVLAEPTASPERRTSPRLNINDPEGVIRQVVRGYWVIRFLAEIDLAFLRKMLQKRQPWQMLEGQIATRLGQQPGVPVSEIDTRVLGYYKTRLPPQQG